MLATYGASRERRATCRSRLESIRGVGSKSSARILTAARRLENDARKRLKVRFDIERRPRAQTGLLNTLRALDEARPLGQLCLPLRMSRYLHTGGGSVTQPGGIVHQWSRQH